MGRHKNGSVTGTCLRCPSFVGDISLTLTSYDGHLSFFVVSRRDGMHCLFVTDLRGIWEIVPVNKRIEWECMNGHRKFEMLRSHVVGIVEPDDDCPYRADVLIETWNS